MIEKLTQYASDTRAFLETVWPRWHKARGIQPSINSTGTCGRSSLFLQKVYLEELAINSNWVTGGANCGLAHSGYYDGADWNNHSWLEIENTHIVDITADQFGEAPILVLPITDPRFQKGTMDCAHPQAIKNRHNEVRQIWAEWLKWKAIKTKV